MKKRSVSPIMTWAFWSVLVLSAFLTVTWEYFVAGLTADTSRITWLILTFFIYGFIASLRVAIHLESEFKSLKAMDENQRIADPKSSDAAAMFDAALERINHGERIEVRNLITAYGAKLKGRVDNIGVVAGMLITIGLLGTVVGLIITVTGLGRVLQSSSVDFASMRAGLMQTVSGMGTAFYTTFFGALLGGVVLKVLSAEMRKSAQILVADALRFSELFVAPQFNGKASDALREMEERVIALNNQIGSMSNSFGHAVEIIDSKQAVLAEGLGNLVATVSQTNAQASERSDQLIQAISGSLDATNTRADERLKAMTDTLEQANAQTAEQVAALVASITESIESANQRADERLSISSDTLGKSAQDTSRHAAEQLEAVAAAVQKNIEETNRQADERLKLLTDAIAKTTDETGRVADERLQTLVRSVDATTQQANKRADAQLTELVENVEKSIESSGKHAEARLTAKAADLAGKLNEAATMLSGLVDTSNVAEDKVHSEEG